MTEIKFTRTDCVHVKVSSKAIRKIVLGYVIENYEHVTSDAEVTMDLEDWVDGFHCINIRQKL
jgi:hypothetical protein